MEQLNQNVRNYTHRSFSGRNKQYKQPTDQALNAFPLNTLHTPY